MSEDFISIDGRRVKAPEWRNPGRAKSRPIADVICVIGYCDAQGVETNRLITCQRLYVSGGHVLLMAFCHRRNAVRHFRVDRILEVIDPATERLFYPVEQFFRQYTIDPAGADKRWLTIARLVSRLRGLFGRFFR